MLEPPVRTIGVSDDEGRRFQCDVATVPGDLGIGVIDAFEI
jgi:hypothetical protein